MLCQQLSTLVFFSTNTAMKQIFTSLLILETCQLMAIKISLVEVSLRTVTALEVCVASFHVCLIFVRLHMSEIIST